MEGQRARRRFYILDLERRLAGIRWRMDRNGLAAGGGRHSVDCARLASLGFVL